MSEEQKVSRSRDHAPTTFAAERTATESSAGREPRAKHTPGPWSTGETDSALIKRGGLRVAQTFPACWQPGGCAFSEQEANAHLIAAAPDLLEALKEVKEILRFALLSTTPEIAREAMAFIREADAAVAKAEGRQ